MATMTKKDLDALMKRSSKEVREDTKRKAAKYKDIWFDLTKNLYRIKLLRDYEKWGYKGWHEYIEKELSLELREVQYWIAIFDKLSLKLSIDEEKIKKLSWTKARAIMPVVTKKNADEWIEKAEKKDRESLTHAVQNKLKGKPEDEGPVMETMHISMTVEEKKTIHKAMETAAKVSPNNNDRPAHLLEMICLHFLGDYPDNRKEAYAEMIAKMEKVFHIKLLAVDKENPKWKESFEQARDIIRGVKAEV